jgi:hypothetical protein
MFAEGPSAMTTIPTWVLGLQAFATPAIALLAVIIGGMQWWLARQKLGFDLFERRFQVFLDVRLLASEAIQLGKLQRAPHINEIVARGRFLFGNDILTSLHKLHSLVLDLELREPSASIKISNLFDEMQPTFAKYLRMHQKFPRLPWQREA